jgi:hypothetical protein
MTAVLSVVSYSYHEYSIYQPIKVRKSLTLRFYGCRHSLTDFSEGVSRCIAEWSEKAAECKGDIECLNESTKQLRGCLDSIFPYSKSIELETDKVNYVMSSVFFLTNRLAKSIIGLAEFDRAISKVEKIGNISLEQKENQELYEGFTQDLDDILFKYF